MIELNDSLKKRGVLFCSNPRGDNQEGFSDERYGFYYEWNTPRGKGTVYKDTQIIVTPQSPQCNNKYTWTSGYFL